MAQLNQVLYSTRILLVIGLLTQQGNGNRVSHINNRQHVSELFKNWDNEKVPRCECSCGLPPAQGRIMNGQVTSILNYPWMVRLFYNNEHHCGGALINDKYVLTAAHCISSDEFELSNLTASFGEQNYCKNINVPKPDNSKRILRVITGDFDSDSMKNDIALLELTDRVQFTEATRPICLPTSSKNQYAEGNATLAGWGNWKDKSEATCLLFKVEVPILDPSECYVIARDTNLALSKSQMCAGYKSGYKGPCFGDSGGPLMKFMDNKNFEIIGITSYGNSYANMPICGNPTVFTRVFHHLSWIKENTKNACYCST